MRKLLIFFTVFPLSIFCQDPNYLSIGLSYSPDYSYRSIRAKDATGKWIADYRNSIESPKYGYTTGLNVALKLTKKLTLEMGLLFSDKGEQEKLRPLNLTTISGHPDPLLPTKMSALHQYMYIDMPIKVNYYLSTEKVKFFITGGLSPNTFLKYKRTINYEYKDGHTSTFSYTDYKTMARINLAIVLGFGINCEINKKLYFKIEPLYRRSIISAVNAPNKTYFYSMGINAGIYYKL